MFRHYELTEEEQLAMRDALAEETSRMRRHKPSTDNGKRRLRVLGALLEQFKADCAKPSNVR